MTIEELNRRLEELKNNHARKINDLEKSICKEKERYQRTKEYLSRQKNKSNL
jgi:hypothetical protein